MGFRERFRDWLSGDVDMGGGQRIPRELFNELRRPEPYTKTAKEKPTSEYLVGEGPPVRVTYPSEVGSLVIRNLQYPYDIVSASQIERFRAKDEEDIAVLVAAFAVRDTAAQGPAPEIVPGWGEHQQNTPPVPEEGNGA